MSKHTPGPWNAVNTGKHWNNPSIDNWVITFNEDGEQIVDHVYEEADARLIAAAPDLLDALRDALCALEVCGKDFPYVMSKANSVIQKVNGKAK